MPGGFQFAEAEGEHTIDFCFDAPADPVHPEGVVMALLRGTSPKGSETNPSPTGETFLLNNAELPVELAGLRGSAPARLRVLSITHQGNLQLAPGGGAQCAAEQLGKTITGTWWCGRARAQVFSEIVLPNGQPRQVTWQLVSIVRERVDADERWRIESAKLQ